MEMEPIYLDHAATTPCDPSVAQAMLPWLSDTFGNPNSIHAVGRVARRAIDESREYVASFFGCRPPEIIFTSGGSESDNLAIRGVADAQKDRTGHIVTSAIEHHAVLHTCQSLEARGFDVTYLMPDEDGLIEPEQVAEVVSDRTILVTVMHGNNEIGTVEPISVIARAVKEKNPDCLVHTDAVQTIGVENTNVADLGVDLLTFTAHKFYGPKSIGGLYARRGVRLLPQITGGGQERNRRSGTESAALIVGLATALKLAEVKMVDELPRLRALRDRLIEGILSTIEGSKLNGHRTQRLSNNVNVSVYGIEGETALLQLDMHNICASSGSACTSGSLDPSHVLTAIGLDHDWAIASLRLTLGRSNTDKDVELVLELLPDLVEKIRALSPMELA